MRYYVIPARKVLEGCHLVRNSCWNLSNILDSWRICTLTIKRRLRGLYLQHMQNLAVCHFGPDSDLDWDTLARTLWTETFWTETFWTGTLWLETLWTKALLKTHFGLTHFGLNCFLSCSLLFFNFEIHFNVKINKLFLCLLWTRQSYITLWRLRKR